MKTEVFTLIIVLVQAVCSHSVEETYQAMTEAIEQCSTTLNVNLDNVIAANREVLVSEDDADMVKVFECYCQKMGMMDDNGDYALDIIKNVVEARVLKTLTKLPNAAEVAHNMANESVEHCKNTPKESNLGVTTIKMRNCIRSYIARPELLA